jgi:uncharacterized protein with GYD domain
MATYISLLHFTRQGGLTIKESPKRRAAATKIIAGMGGTLVHTYLTLGRYDGVVIFEAPDDHTAAKIALLMGTQGDSSAETLRAFPEEEFDRMLKSLP